jgi:AcrR family transcriptional regulator
MRERLRSETAGVILDAAEAAIGDDGLYTARMETIAGRAGVSVGTLYNHFQSREALVGALRESRIGLLRDLLHGALAPVEERPVREQLLALLGAMRAHAQRHGRLLAALMAERLGPSSCRPPVEARSEIGARTRELVERAAARGELREDPAGLAAEALTALARLVLVRTVEGRCGEEELAQLADLFLQGVAR